MLKKGCTMFKVTRLFMGDKEAEGTFDTMELAEAHVDNAMAQERSMSLVFTSKFEIEEVTK